MEKFTKLTAKACPLALANLDTDQIVPARFLKMPRREGHARALFHDLRFDAQGRERPDFPLNREVWRDARILVAERNFGGGSSREAAAYALVDFGIRCVVAPSFGDIFAQNAANNGVLAAVLPDAEVAELAAALASDPARPVTVDLAAQTVACGNRVWAFTVDPVRRARLLNGWDDLDLTAQYRDAISAFHAGDRRRRPWAEAARG